MEQCNNSAPVFIVISCVTSNNSENFMCEAETHDLEGIHLANRSHRELFSCGYCRKTDCLNKTRNVP